MSSKASTFFSSLTILVLVSSSIPDIYFPLNFLSSSFALAIPSLGNLEKTYKAVIKSCPTTLIDSFEAVKEVEAYRQFWKPNRTNIVLLAELHVYTDHADFGRQLNQKYIQRILPSYPSHFVRFIYCLGYGEDSLLNGDRGERPNTGTPQFWKIFSYCAAENPDNPQDYKVLKTATPNFPERMQNKVALLQKLKEKGIWLMDAHVPRIDKESTKCPIDQIEGNFKFLSN